MRLPLSLERQLQQLFPDSTERMNFVVDAVERALEGSPAEDKNLPEAIGGTLHLFTDGGSRGNPGQAAIAAIVEDPIKGEVIREHYERIGIETNNEIGRAAGRGR